jgi:hypothetical protein
MKKIHLCLIIMLLLSTVPPPVFASEKNITSDTINRNEKPTALKKTLNRLEEIKAMDKSSMSRLEKKELRKELRTIKANLKAKENSVLLSIGGIVIIIGVMVLALM